MEQLESLQSQARQAVLMMGGAQEGEAPQTLAQQGEAPESLVQQTTADGSQALQARDCLNYLCAFFISSKLFE